MKRKNILLSSIAVSAFLIFSFSHNLHAAKINGSISFGMSGQAMNAGGNLPDFTGATGINFDTPAPVLAIPGADLTNASVQGSSGDFATAGFTTVGAVAIFEDFFFNPASTPVIPLWTATTDPLDALSGLTASFDLLSLTVIGQTANELDIVGNGVLHLAGFDDTPGAWTLSGDIVNNSLTFGFSSTNVAIPEPGMLALLGLGLVGFGIGRLKKNKA